MAGYAARFVDEIYDAFEFLCGRPRAGHKRSDLTDRPSLFWPVMRSFAIIYRVADPLVIVRVVRWRRTTRSFLGDEV
jgi:plasmid stabilization system protein ParE